MLGQSVAQFYLIMKSEETSNNMYADSDQHADTRTICLRILLFLFQSQRAFLLFDSFFLFKSVEEGFKSIGVRT